MTPDTDTNMPYDENLCRGVGNFLVNRPKPFQYVVVDAKGNQKVITTTNSMPDLVTIDPDFFTFDPANL